MKKLIIEVGQEMANLLNNMYMEELHNTLLKRLQGLTFTNKANNKNLYGEKMDYCNIFICAKRVEGCSEKSLKYSKLTIENMLKTLDKPVKYITMEDLRGYLVKSLMIVYALIYKKY